MFAPLLDGLADAGLDLARTVVTADALHTQRAHAEYLHQRRASRATSRRVGSCG